jgi:hypothetical protein
MQRRVSLPQVPEVKIPETKNFEKRLRIFSSRLYTKFCEEA